MQDKKQQLERDREQQTGSKLGKEYVKALYCNPAYITHMQNISCEILALYCNPAYLTHMQNISCEILGWMKQKLESRLAGETSVTSDMQMTPP